MPWDLRDVTPEVIATIRRYGFTGVASRYYDPLNVTEQDVKHLSDIIHDALQNMRRVTRRLGAENLYVRPCSVNPRGSWLPHPDNGRPETGSPDSLW